MNRISSLIVALTLLLFGSLPTRSQDNLDAQRCNGVVAASAQDQIASCSTLINSGNFSGQTLAVIYSNRAVLLSQQADYAKAIADFDQALALDPSNAQSLYDRGVAKRKSGDLAGGNVDMAQAQQMNPQVVTVDESAFANAMQPPTANLAQALASAMRAPAPVNSNPSQSIPRGDLLRPGEAYVTRFSGVTVQPGPGGQQTVAINTAGTVGSIIDVRSPNRPPRGDHWYDEPQRNPVTAGEVGQVFGVVLDDATPPNVYLSATSAFGLHLAPGTQRWMPGMWGAGGGPGTIYRLSRDNGYRPSVFANVTLGGRANSGAALGNMAFDRSNKQLFVSDLETGMIHRIRAGDGADLGSYDHGVIGRANFFDAENNVAGSLPAIAFDPNSSARLANCPAGSFERSPQCWNFAASGRRVWGLGVRRDVSKNETRVYYAVWSSPTFANEQAWNAASDDDKRNSVWSIRLGPGGSFDITDIRREFMLPDFFVQPNDIARAGYSQPVSDISFSDCSDRPVMLIAERGGIRNLGLNAENPFAFPHEARALRYELDTTGVWRPVGRYDVGYYDRKNEGQPFLRANCAGGIAFAPGYTPSWTIDLAKPDQFVWMTGDYLCSPEGPCHLSGTAPAARGGIVLRPASVTQIEQDGDDSQVHGVQGLAEGAFDELMPAGALTPYPTGEAPPYPVTGPDQSYLIDTDINIDAAGNLIEAELLRNDATKIGDIAIYEICVPRRQTAFLPPPAPDAPPPVLVGHDSGRSHYRFGSHNLYWSHNRFRSHNAGWSHSRIGSHNPRWSHSRRASHVTAISRGWRHDTAISRGRWHVAAISRGWGWGHDTAISRGWKHVAAISASTNWGGGGGGGAGGGGGGGCGGGSAAGGGGACGGGSAAGGGGGGSTASGSGSTVTPTHPQPPTPAQPSTPLGSTSTNSGYCETLNGKTTCYTQSCPPSGASQTCTTTADYCDPCKPPSSAQTPATPAASSRIVLRPRTSIGETHQANVPNQPNPCRPASNNSPPASSSGGIVLRQRTYGQHPSAGQTHQASQGTAANPCHAGSSSTRTGNSHRGASLTRSGQHTTSSRSHTPTHRSSSYHRSARGGHGRSRTSFRPARVASHSFGGGRGGFRGGGFHGGGRHSDLRLKEDIVPLARLANGIGVYRFRYKGNDRTVYVGVMAQEVREIVPSAVARGRDGYLRVDYGRLGLEFTTWDEWVRRAGAGSAAAR